MNRWDPDRTRGSQKISCFVYFRFFSARSVSVGKSLEYRFLEATVFCNFYFCNYSFLTFLPINVFICTLILIKNVFCNW